MRFKLFDVIVTQKAVPAKGLQRRDSVAVGELYDPERWG